MEENPFNQLGKIFHNYIFYDKTIAAHVVRHRSTVLECKTQHSGINSIAC